MFLNTSRTQKFKQTLSKIGAKLTNFVNPISIAAVADD
jgi:hypothetical protein